MAFPLMIREKTKATPYFFSAHPPCLRRGQAMETEADHLNKCVH